MSINGIDYADGYPGVQPILDGGYKFVCRYLPTSSWKGLTQREYNELTQAGIKVVLTYETTETNTLNGFDEGASDANIALQLIHDLGIITTAPIYFCVDTELDTQNKINAVKDYFKGVASNLPLTRIGVYGGLATVSSLFDDGLITYGWQTLAWSHGRWDSRAQIRQISTETRYVGGASVDLDVAMVDDYGAV